MAYFNNSNVGGANYTLPGPSSMNGNPNMVDYQLTNNSILNCSVNFHTNNSHQAQLPIAGQTGGNSLLPSN